MMSCPTCGLHLRSAQGYCPRCGSVLFPSPQYPLPSPAGPLASAEPNSRQFRFLRLMVLLLPTLYLLIALAALVYVSATFAVAFRPTLVFAAQGQCQITDARLLTTTSPSRRSVTRRVTIYRMQFTYTLTSSRDRCCAPFTATTGSMISSIRPSCR